MIDKLKAYWPLDQNIRLIWVLILISRCHVYFFNLADFGWQCSHYGGRYSFSEIEDSFYGSSLQEMNQILRWIKITSRFLEWWGIVTVFSNWYWNFQPSRFLISCNAMAQVAAQLVWHCCLCRYLGRITTGILERLRRFYPCRDAQKVTFSPFFCYVPPNWRMIRITAELMQWFGMGSLAWVFL